MQFLCKRVAWVSIIATLLLLLLFAALNTERPLSNLAQSSGNFKLPDTNLRTEGRECQLSYGHYSGLLWSKAGETTGRTCLLESSRMRVDHHIRTLPDGNTIKDWLWIDYGDRVNVVVQEKSTDGSGYKYVVLEQTKYALEGTSLAVVGGFLEDHESPEAAAIREVREELSLECEVSKLKVLVSYIVSLSVCVCLCMSICVSFCVCMYVCVCVYIFVHASVCVCLSVCVCARSGNTHGALW